MSTATATATAPITPPESPGEEKRARQWPAKYQYEPIEGVAAIRVLELRPSRSPDAPLECTLAEAGLDDDNDDEPYHALSYTWGTAAATEQLFISSASPSRDDPHHHHGGTRVLGITPNLRDALARLRSPWEPVRLWVDAVCINQGDAREKARQIPLMAQIYRGAASVRVWLGADDAAAADGLRLVARLTAGAGDQSHDASGKQGQERLLASLLARPWWLRRWIVQEVVLNGHVVVACGDAPPVPWIRLAQVLRGRAGDGLPRPVRAILELWKAQILGVAEADTRLVSLLESFSDFACFDPRDRIYAIAGLASGVRINAPEPHHDSICLHATYERSVEEVFHGAAKAVVRAGERDSSDLALQILLSASVRMTDAVDINMPSWAPDWRRQRRLRRLRPSWDSPFQARVAEEDDGILVVSPHKYMDIIGEVTGVTDAFPDDASLNSVVAWLKHTRLVICDWMRDISAERLADNEVVLLNQLVDLLVAGEVKDRPTRHEDNLKLRRLLARLLSNQDIEDQELADNILVKPVADLMAGRRIFRWSASPAACFEQQALSTSAMFKDPDPQWEWVKLGVGAFHVSKGDKILSFEHQWKTGYDLRSPIPAAALSAMWSDARHDSEGRTIPNRSVQSQDSIFMLREAAEVPDTDLGDYYFLGDGYVNFCGHCTPKHMLEGKRSVRIR
ncbi:heterokaryon incompatibility protein-domain-containing protein [Xylariomycetidae sp. FL0641]|nr:heterokaryon incompatibility protein-domain-containing protein [Xylariomycetidae sp. FL0641]